MAHGLTHQAETFLEQAQFVTADAVRNEPHIIPSEPGIYGWWFDGSFSHLCDGTHARDGFHLLYVGIAPSAPPREGVKSRTIRDRLLNHCRGPLATSTLRRTLAALLKSEEQLAIDRTASGKSQMSGEDEAKLTGWMTQHARITWLTTPQPWKVETELLESGPRLPLNIRGSSDPYRTELRQLRAGSAPSAPKG